MELNNEDEENRLVAPVEEEVDNIELERQILLNNISSGRLYTQRDKVAYVLNNFSETRNSDIELAWTYWRIYHHNIFDGQSVTKSLLYRLPRISSLTRSRAKIQNEYNLFQADDLIKKYRGVLKDEMKNEAIEDKPAGVPMLSIYIDETGKTGDYLSVGSLWVADGGLSTLKVVQDIDAWKEQKEINVSTPPTTYWI